MNAVLETRGLGKAYRHYPSSWSRLREWLSPSGKLLHEPHWVLRHLDITVPQGESVGIVGRNGAGKSTLLKVLTGTTPPTEGSMRLRGRVAALLELGMGFHADFTGRQNAIMSGQLQGMSDAEVRDLLPAVAEFAEIGDAFDQPVRTYSSGMHVRLAFSVATAMRPDILIVDEALAVGDVYFQHKCYRRIRHFKEQGTTLLFVSHDPLAIKSLCERAILIEGGVIATDGTPDQVLDYYNALIALDEKRAHEHDQHIESKQEQTRSGNAKASIVGVELLVDGVSHAIARIGEPALLRVVFRVNEPIERLNVGIMIRDRIGNEIYGVNTDMLGYAVPRLEQGREHKIDFRIARLDLGHGSYNVTVALHRALTHLDENYDWWDQALTFQMASDGPARFVGVARLDVSVAVVD